MAYQKPARQSSTYAVDEQASKAVDNNTDPNYNSHSCAITQHENQGSWWQVDLLQPYNIYSVVITNRGDCCGQYSDDDDDDGVGCGGDDVDEEEEEEKDDDQDDDDDDDDRFYIALFLALEQTHCAFVACVSK